MNESRELATRPPQISASILNADFARLGDEVRRAEAGGVDSIHLDVMDGHFVGNISLGPVVVEAVRGYASVPFHSHLMISQPLHYIRAFAEAGSDVIIFHLEADDDAREVIDAIRATGRQVGLAINPETRAHVVLPYVEQVDMLLVMTVHPGWGGQELIADVLPKLRALRDAADELRLDLPIGVDGGVNLSTIGSAHAAGGDVLVTGKALYEHSGDLTPVVAELRGAARAGAGAKGSGAPDAAATAGG